MKYLRVAAVAVVVLGFAGIGTVAAQSAPDCSELTYSTDMNDAYVVEDVDQLQCIANSTEGPGLDENYVLTSDIDASETEEWLDNVGFDDEIGDRDISGNTEGEQFDLDNAPIKELVYTDGVDVELVDPENGTIELQEDIGTDVFSVRYLTERKRQQGFRPIGYSGNEFSGTLDGNGYSIKYLSINRSNVSQVGLFGATDGAEIRNLNVEEVNISGESLMGGLIGVSNDTNVRDISITGEINPTRCCAGGLIGEVNEDGRFKNVQTDVQIDSVISYGCCLGGLFGWTQGNVILLNSNAEGDVNDGIYGCCSGGLAGWFGEGGQTNITNSYATGDVNTGCCGGGLAGWIDRDAMIKNSYAEGDVTARGSGSGGFAGWFDNNVVVQDSYATGNVTEKYCCVGGFVGGMWGNKNTIIRGSFATGDVKVTDDHSAGGFFGSGGGKIVRSFATGDVNGTGEYIGGFGGRIDASVFESYATGDVKGFNSDVGGFAGGISNGAIVNKSYALGDVTGKDVFGGFVGRNEGTINEAYSVGTPTATDTGATNVGGFVGRDETTGSTSVATTQRTETDEFEFNDDIDFPGPRERPPIPNRRGAETMNTTETTDDDTVTIQSSGGISDAYWDERASGTIRSDGGIPLTTDEMTGVGAPSNMLGFDFNNTWVTVAGEYPVLQNSPALILEGFRVGIIDADVPTEEGGTLEVEAKIKNVGENDTQDVELFFNNTGVMDTSMLSLDEGESGNVTLEGVVNSASGEFTATVSTENDSETINILEYIAGSAAEDGINLIARSDMGESITVGVGETVAIGFPREGSSGRVTEQPGKYNWSVHEFSEGNTSDGQLLYTDNDDLPDQPDFDEIDERDARATSFRPEEAGRYVIELETDKEVFSNESVGGENIGHTTIINVTKTGDKELLDRHSPVLKFHPDEEFYPTRLEAIFDNTFLCQKPSNDKILESATLYDVGGITPSDYGDRRYLQPYPVTEEQAEKENTDTCENAGTSLEPLIDDFKHYNPEPYANSSDSPYPRTVYGTVRENVSFDPSDEPHRSDYEKAGFRIPEERSGNYTALIYVSEYVNDPKPKNARGNLWELIKEQNLVEEILDSGARGFDELAAHTGDGSVVIVLLDDDENPEWVLAQQHLGGEFRLWEHVETTREHPVMYIAEGAHTSFFGLITQGQSKTARDIREGIGLPRYPYQQQYLCPTSCSGNDRGDTTIAEFGDVDISPDINGYVDHTTDGVGGTDDETWAQTDNVSGIDETYEIAVVDSEKGEAWTDYSGDIYTYPPKLIGTGGKIPQQGTKWNRPGEWADNITFANVAETGGGFLVDGRGQTNASFPNSDRTYMSIGAGFDEAVRFGGIVLPEGEDFEDIVTRLRTGGFGGISYPDLYFIQSPPAVVGIENPDNGVGMNIINNGMQPHEFNLHLRNSKGSAGVDYSFYANSIYPNNLVGADDVKIDQVLQEEEGSQEIEAHLTAYPTENPSSPGKYVFDRRTVVTGDNKDDTALPFPFIPLGGPRPVPVERDSGTLSTRTKSSGQEYNTTPIVELDLDFGRGNMGSVNSVTLDIEGEDPVTVSSPPPSDSVSEQEVRFLSPTSEPESRPKMRFRAPSKNETGQFDVGISVEYTTGDVVSGTLEDYLVYEEEDEVASLVELNAGTTDEKYYAGSNAEITATLLGTEPVNDATVDAEVTKPNGSTETVDLERFGEGLYTGTLRIGQNVTSGDVRGKYNATVTATVPGGVTREQDVSWEVGFNSPVDVKQTEVQSVEPGEVADAEVGITSIAGARSVEVGLSNIKHDRDRIVSTEDAIPNASHIVTQDERTAVQAEIRVPEEAEPGTYRGTVGALVTDTETPTVEEVRIEVEPPEGESEETGGDTGGTGECVPRRDASRGETDECSDDRDLSRGDERGYERRDRGRGD